jgi:uncharacterized membrane protein
MTMRNKSLQWLYSELPQLVKAGVLSEDAAASLRSHYGEARAGGRGLWISICAVLGSLLIGAGVILLLAYNWTDFSRGVRTLLSFAPLLTAQGIAIWVFFSRRDGVALREGVALFWSLAVASSIALIGQTYHIPGDMGGFLLVWACLVLPLIYLMRSTVVAMLFLVIITSWSGHSQERGGDALAFWLLLAGVLPYVVCSTRASRYAPSTAWLGWALSLCLCCGTGIALEKVMPGLWIVIYASLFGVLYLAGSYWFDDAPTDWQKPYHVIGAGGIATMTFLLTMEWAWDDVGWRYYRYGYCYNSSAAWIDYAFAVLLPIAAICLLVTAVRRRESTRLLFGVMPIVAILGFCLVAFGVDDLAPMILFNIYAFVLGVGCIYLGGRSGRLAIVNAGMVMVTALIVARFFDVDLGLVARGLAFILIGVSFLATNLVVAKRAKARVT